MEFKFVLTREEIKYLTEGLVLFERPIFQAIQGMKRSDKECAVSLPSEKLRTFVMQVAAAEKTSENPRARRTLRELFGRLNGLFLESDEDVKGNVVALLHTEFENSDFIHDVTVFLDYVAHNKIQLSPSYGYIPRKHWKKINELFVKPESIIEIDGKPKRIEEEMRRFYFIDLLTLNCDLTKTLRNKVLAVTKRYKEYLALDNFSRMGSILNNWMFYIDWSVFCPYPACEKYTKLNEYWDIIVPIFKKLMPRFEDDILISEVAIQILDETGLVDESLPEYMRKFQDMEVKHLIFDPLHYFGLIRYITEDWHGIPVPKYFNINPLLFDAFFVVAEKAGIKF